MSDGFVIHPERGPVQRLMTQQWCHQCKMRKEKVVCCDNFWAREKDIKCNGRYCEGCMRRHYNEEFSPLETATQWTCFRCRGLCKCAACKRRRARDALSAGQGLAKRRRKVVNAPSRYDEDFHPPGEVPSAEGIAEAAIRRLSATSLSLDMTDEARRRINDLEDQLQTTQSELIRVKEDLSDMKKSLAMCHMHFSYLASQCRSTLSESNGVAPTAAPTTETHDNKRKGSVDFLVW